MSWAAGIAVVTAWGLLTWIIAREIELFLNSKPPGITPGMMRKAFNDAINGR